MPWEKVLWKQHGEHADNYTDKSFLGSMSINKNLSDYAYLETVYCVLLIVSQFLMTTVFLFVFRQLEMGSLHSGTLVCVDLGMLLVVIFASIRSEDTQVIDALWGLAKMAYFLFMLLAVTSPLLKSLTETFSTDTIWALSIFCLIVHLLAFDYKGMRQRNGKLFNLTRFSFQGTLALNASVSATVLFASRLDSIDHVAVFLLFSFELFIGVPLVMAALWQRWPHLFVLAVLCMLCLVVYWLNEHAMPVVPLLSLLAMLAFGVPCLWVYLHMNWKCRIEGPWDYDTAGEVTATVARGMDAANAGANF